MSTTTHQPTEAPVPEHLREHLIAAASRYLGLQLRASGEAFDEETADAPSLARVDAAREAYATLREGGTSIAADVMVAVAEDARYWIATPLGEGHGPTDPRERARAHRDVADLELLAAGLPLEEDASSAGHPSSLTAYQARVASRWARYEIGEIGARLDRDVTPDEAVLLVEILRDLVAFWQRVSAGVCHALDIERVHGTLRWAADDIEQDAAMARDWLDRVRAGEYPDVDVDDELAAEERAAVARQAEIDSAMSALNDFEQRIIGRQGAA